MKYKLLIAEDIPAERAVLRHVIEQALGSVFTVFEAEDGTQALELFYRERPDIALLNIEMPGLSGLEVAQKIRESNKLCAIVFISDFDNFSYAQQAITLRALDYILKPWTNQRLLTSLQDALNYISQLETINWEPAPLRPPVPQSALADQEDARITLVREDISTFINSHYMEELSMKNVAHAMNYSDAYFCKLFKQCFHVNFSTYLNEYRIEKAKTMMANPRITVKDISLACGYTDSNYFARVFKRVTGQTPTEYRLSSIEKALGNEKV